MIIFPFQSVKDLMDIMKDKDSLMQIRNNNHQALLEQLDSIIGTLDLEHKHMKALLDGDLTSPAGIYECTQAANALHKCMQQEIHKVQHTSPAGSDSRRKY